MKKTMKIEGLMCGHCQANATKALEALDFVNSAEVSFETGTAIVDLKEDGHDEALKNAIVDAGYKVVGIE